MITDIIPMATELIVISSDIICLKKSDKRYHHSVAACLLKYLRSRTGGRLSDVNSEFIKSSKKGRRAGRSGLEKEAEIHQAPLTAVVDKKKESLS